ncbi:MAG TPA: cupin domain-containing protein [Ktedonobacterales bacterium]|nr:cupin domain-containing protein [Ktedonobacterales bacterium]
MTQFHLRPLPSFSTLLSGRTPPDDVGFQSERLWVWYHNTDEGWVEPVPHLHQSSDECFIVLRGSLIVEVEGERHTVGPREFCCFPAGVYHRIVEVQPPLESLMLRSPLVTDKVYQRDAEESSPRP